MTFDARGGDKSTGGSTLTFGAITILVVAGAFFAVLNLPKKSTSSAPLPVADAVIESTQHAGLEGKSAEAFLRALGQIDPGARADLDRRLSRADAHDHARIALATAGKVLDQHQDTLAQANARHVDVWLEMTRKQLQSASRSDHRWCAGSRYQNFDTASGFSSQMAAASDLADLGSELTDYSFASINIAFAAIEDARVRPVQHGALTHQDESALQGVAMSIISDPQIMPLLLAANADGPSPKMLDSLDMCELGVTAVTALKTLPQGTKGRAFSEFVKSADFDSGDLSQLERLSRL